MAITPLPTPPSRSTPSTFSTLADAFLGALPTFQSECNAVAEAMDLNDTSDTSTSSNTIGTGAKTFTVTAGKSFLPGMSLKIARTSAPSNFFHGTVTSYSSTTLVMNITYTEGSGGPFTDWTISFSAPIVVPDESGLPLGYISGLGISHAADTEHDITVAVGEARDATDAVDIVLASAITKQFDATWAVGTNAGGFASGESLPASGTIHIWLIKRSDTGVVDVMANNHATTGLTPTLPTNYDYKRRIFSLRTNASNNIINGDQWGTGVNRTFMYDTPILDVANGSPGTSAVTAALSVPSGIIVRAITNAHIYIGAAYLSSLANDDLAPVATVMTNPLASHGGMALNDDTAFYGQSECFIFTNTSSQIRYRRSCDRAIGIATIGWEDSF